MVTVTVPANNTKALLAAARMFQDLAGADAQIQGVAVEDTTIPASSAEAPAPDTVNEIDLPGEGCDIERKIPVSQGGSMPDIELDSDDLPWDKRIHASTKSKTQDGRWKKKRGVPKEEYDAVVAELKLNADEEDEYEDYEADLALREAAGAVTPPAPPAAPEVSDETPPEAPVVAPEAPKYNGFGDIYEALEPNGLTMDDLAIACRTAGLKYPAMLAARPDLASQIAESLGLK